MLRRNLLSSIYCIWENDISLYRTVNLWLPRQIEIKKFHAFNVSLHIRVSRSFLSQYLPYLDSSERLFMPKTPCKVFSVSFYWWSPQYAPLIGWKCRHSIGCGEGEGHPLLLTLLRYWREARPSFFSSEWEEEPWVLLSHLNYGIRCLLYVFPYLTFEYMLEKCIKKANEKLTYRRSGGLSCLKGLSHEMDLAFEDMRGQF